MSTSAHALENYMRYRNDEWAFLTECVYTLDQVSKDEPIKLFPDKEYLKLYCRLWKKYPLLAVPKSRRMTLSWATIGLFVHDTIFHKGRFNAFVSKKEDDANELVNRAKFIIDNLGDSIPKELLPKYNHKFCVLDFPELMSKIQGFPQGADQLRQFTFSGIFGDESAFWEHAQEFYAASFPTIDGGGRMTLVSSPAPGFFKKLCFDALGVLGDINVAEYSPNAKAPLQGVRVWQNPKNRFLVVELHYTADPGKRHAEYKESIKNSMPLQEYLREYELHWDTFDGMPVYPEFSKLHVLEDEPTPVPGLPMLIGFDFGRTPAAVIGQIQEEQLIIFKEYTEINMGLPRFLEKIMPDMRMRFPTFGDFKKNWLCFIDPAGMYKHDTDENTCALILGAHFTVIPGPAAWEARYNAVTHFLKTLTTEGPAFQLYARECPMLVKGFQGGYKYKEESIDVEPNKLRPVKNLFSHPHDALQMIAAGVRVEMQTMRRQIPRPTYSITEKDLKHGTKLQ